MTGPFEADSRCVTPNATDLLTWYPGVDDGICPNWGDPLPDYFRAQLDRILFRPVLDSRCCLSQTMASSPSLTFTTVVRTDLGWTAFAMSVAARPELYDLTGGIGGITRVSGFLDLITWMPTLRELVPATVRYVSTQLCITAAALALTWLAETDPDAVQAERVLFALREPLMPNLLDQAEAVTRATTAEFWEARMSALQTAPGVTGPSPAPRP